MERLVAAPRRGLRVAGVNAKVVEREHTVKVQAPTSVGSERRARAREARTAEGRTTMRRTAPQSHPETGCGAAQGAWVSRRLRR
jgi:hypothetical protein